jgi:hypothetical protein
MLASISQAHTKNRAIFCRFSIPRMSHKNSCAMFGVELVNFVLPSGVDDKSGAVTVNLSDYAFA